MPIQFDLRLVAHMGRPFPTMSGKAQPFGCTMSKSHMGSSSQETIGTDYEVFLNFRGTDTRRGFASVLHEKMKEAKVRVFMDDEAIRVGSEISEELQRAIVGAKIHIPIFSRNYAESAWCLGELSLMVECNRRSNGEQILPIFYDATPEDVKLKTSLYTNALIAHEKKFGVDRVQKWRDALSEVQGIKGWKLGDNSYPEFCKKIVALVLLKLKEKCGSTHLVGMKDHAEAIEKMLDVDSGDVRFLVIHGVSGTGKTTLAKFLFNRFAFRYQGCSFLADVGETSRHYGLKYPKNQLYRDIPDDGDDSTNMSERFLNKRVLIVLDDVDQEDQILNLVGKSIWFGPGSRIIITTTHRSVMPFQQEATEGTVFEQPKEVWAFPMKEMTVAHAIQLFSRHAFGEDSPPPKFESLAREIIGRAGRLPLTLEVIGSLLHRKDKEVWRETLEKLRKISSNTIQEKLKISYDALNDEAKQVFLDIACLFVNKEKTNPLYMWEACHHSNGIECKGIEILLMMSLVKVVDNNILWMHDHLRNLGRNLVRKECLGDLGACSRLWLHREALEVLMRKEGKENVEALRLHYDDSLRNYSLTREEFGSLKSLRFLEMNRAYVIGNLENLLLELRWLSWHYCPGNLTATNIFLLNLVILDLSWSRIKYEWAGWRQLKEANNLKVLDLTSCRNLKRTPSFSRYKNLERLILEDCKELTEIDDSIGELRGLQYLNMKGCDSLERFPETVGLLESLVELTITKTDGGSLCLPESIGEMRSLCILEIANTTLNFPQSIGGLQRLERLSLSRCHGMENLPSLENLTALVELDISQSGIVELPDSIQFLKELKVIKMEQSRIRELPIAIGMAEKLQELHAKGSKDLSGNVPDEIGKLLDLRILDLACTGISGLPRTMSKLPRLQSLNLESCKKLVELPELPTSLTSLRVSSCSLCAIPDLSTLTNLVDLVMVGVVRDLGESEAIPSNLDWIVGLVKLETLELDVPSFIPSLPCNFGAFPQLKSLHLSCSDLQCCLELPSSLSRLILSKVEINTMLPHIAHLKGLSILQLDRCTLIDKHELDILRISNLQSLVHFSAHDCLFDIGLRLPKVLCALSIIGCTFRNNRLLDLSGLKHLKKLELLECPGLAEVRSVGDLRQLQELMITDCESLERLDDMLSLRKLEDVQIHDCEKLCYVGNGDVRKLSSYTKHSSITHCPSLKSSRVAQRPRGHS